MKLLLVRHFEVLDTPGTPLTPKTEKRPAGPRGDATIGALEIDGVFECHTLEDVQRSVKIHGATAIPVGTYDVSLQDSPRFSTSYAKAGHGAKLPRLASVPGYDGVLIHIGNFAVDTEGCILVGSWNKNLKNMISGSKIAYRQLHAKLASAEGTIRLTIRDEVARMDTKLRHPPRTLFDSMYGPRGYCTPA